MREQREPGGLAATVAGWSAGVVAAFALYVLSIGPLEKLHAHGLLPGDRDLWRAIYAPVVLLHDHTPLQGRSILTAGGGGE